MDHLVHLVAAVVELVVVYPVVEGLVNGIAFVRRVGFLVLRVSSSV